MTCYQEASRTPAIADVSCNMDILLMPDTEKSRPTSRKSPEYHDPIQSYTPRPQLTGKIYYLYVF